MNGELTTIATNSDEPSRIELQGRVDEFGQVRVTGTVTPLDPPADTDLRVVFENVDMPKLSAYSVPFAGREIASGRLDLDLGYQISDGALEGENRIVLRDFELGDKVDHPGALSLPLGLAVALLKDPDGRINLDVPVRGDVNDPEFRYGGVVVKAVLNLITRIVTSPFALLANLVGAEADELEFVTFAAGSGELSPPELEKAAKIAAALALRPQLVLQMAGTFDPISDSAVLKAAKVDQRIDERVAGAEDSEETMFAERRQAAIEALVAESTSITDPSLVIDELRAAHTRAESDNAPGQFDALAYTESLRDRLIDAEPMENSELIALGESRAARAQQAILEADASIAAQILIERPASAVTGENNSVQVQVRLSADEDVSVRNVDVEAGGATDET